MSGDTVEAFGRKWKRVRQKDEPAHEGYEHMNETWRQLLDVGAIYVPVEAETPPVALARQVGDPPSAVTAHLAGDVHPAYVGVIEYMPPVDPYTAMAREFHQRMGLVTRDAPSLGTPAEREERVRLMVEELLEFAGALGVSVLAAEAGELEMKDLGFYADEAPDLSGALHELADLQVTVSGTAEQFGLPLLAATREVHRANMEKTPQGPGRKPLKPEGWKPADVSKALDGSGGGET